MSNYPPTSQGYNYNYTGGNQPPPPQQQPPYSSTGTNPNQPPYGSSSPSSAPPYAVPYGAPKPQSSYGTSSPSAPYAPSPNDYNKPPKDKPYGSYGAPPPSGSSDYGNYSYGSVPNRPPPSGSSDYGNYSHGSAPNRPPVPSGSSDYGNYSYGSAPIRPPPSGSSDYGNYSYGSAPNRPNQPYGSAQPRPVSSGGSYGGGYQQQQGGYGSSAFGSLIPSGFAPGTDPNIVACFQAADQDGSGFIDDKELQGALSSYLSRFSMRTVHLLMYLFTNSSVMKIGPKEFTALFYSLQNWRSIFERSDKDRSGRIDVNELRDALLSLGFSVPPVVLDLLVSKFDKSGGRNKAIEYDNFIECCLTVKGLTEKFKEKDTGYSGSATFTYETFMLTVLPFLIA